MFYLFHSGKKKTGSSMDASAYLFDKLSAKTSFLQISCSSNLQSVSLTILQTRVYTEFCKHKDSCSDTKM
jgi:hypothetical protein